MPPTETPHPETPTDSAFAGLGLAEASIRVVHELGYNRPTPIQARALPVLLRGEDLVGQSATGSGKTVAFGLPLLERVDLDDLTVQGLVLCPTRELAAQVGAAIRTLGRHRPGLRVLVVAGGQPSGPQRKAIEAGVHVVVGTPGRVNDLLDRELDLGGVKVVVLDEADRMLDMGFLPGVEQILEKLPETRQTVLFSATIPESIAAMSKAWQRSPTRIVITDSARNKPQIRQVAHAVTTAQRPEALRAVLADAKGPLGLASDGSAAKAASVLVFCNFKTTVRNVATDLAEQGFAVDAIHGDLEQRDRDRVLAKFRNGSTRILVATDVAARGLDIAGIDAVVNYELPPSPEVYVHRIGRTGRAGAPGLAISLVTPNDTDRMHQGEAASGGRIVQMPLPATAPVPTTARALAHSAPPVADMVTLLVRGGRKDKLRPGDVLGALTGEGGCTAEHIGLIEIHDEFAYVAVAKAMAAKVAALGRLRIKGRTVRIEPLK